MIKVMYALKDTQVNAFMRPVFLSNDAECRRLMINTLTQDEMIKKFPDDFVMYCLGRFNEETGLIDVLPDPQRMFSASEILRILEVANEIN